MAAGGAGGARGGGRGPPCGSGRDAEEEPLPQRSLLQEDPEDQPRVRMLRRTKRHPAPPEPDILPPDDSGSEELGPAQPGEVDQEVLTERDLKRRKMEREWLRHKRQQQLKEEGLLRQREEKAAKARRRAAEAESLDVATMSKEDKSRYEAVVAAVGLSGHGGARKAKTSPALAALIGREEDEDDARLLNGFQTGQPRRARFIVGPSAAAAAR